MRKHLLSLGVTAMIGALLVQLGSASQADSAYFTVTGTGFSFVKPKDWTVQKARREQRLLISSASKHGPVVMHFYTVDFRKPISDWQDTQVFVAQEFKRSIDRQWQEEILGVPLVLTKTSGVDSHGVPDVVLTGMLYSATKNKMLFRLTCLASDFDDGNAAWREAFQSLRTTDGNAPVADDPNKKLSKDELAPKPTGPLPVTQLGEPTRKVKLFEPPVTVAGKAGGKNASIRLPVGWKATRNKDGTWAISCTALELPITMSLASTLDSDAPDSALMKQSAASLDAFATVKSRDDVESRLNKAGATYSSVWRTGTGKHGEMTSFDATVTSGDLYVTFQLVAPKTLDDAQKKALKELLAETTIDSSP